MLWQECLTQKKIVGMSFKSFPWLNHFCRLLAYGYLKFVETSNKNSFITVFLPKVNLFLAMTLFCGWFNLQILKIR